MGKGSDAIGVPPDRNEAADQAITRTHTIVASVPKVTLSA